MAEITSFHNILFRTDSKKVADDTAKDLNRMQESSKKASDSAKKLGDETEKSGAMIAKSTGEMDKSFKSAADSVSSSTERIAKSTGEADRRFKKLGDEASSSSEKIKKFGGGFDGLIGKLGGGAKGLAMAGAAFAGIGLSVLGAISTFKRFEQSIADLSSITGATGKDLEFYSNAAREMGASTTLSASEVADAFRIVGSAKPDLLKNAEGLKEVTRASITLAEAAGIAVPDAANTMASALNQFGEGADQAERYINVLAAGAVAGAAEIAEIGESMKFAGVVAGQFGISFEQTNAALQLFSTNAVKGGEAGTQFKGVILALETRMADKFKPSVVGLQKALENLKNENLSASEKVKLFGRENFVAGEILANNTEKLEEMTNAVTGTNIAYDQAKTRTETLDGAMKRLKNAFEEIQLTLTADTGFGNVLTAVVNIMTEFLRLISFSIKGLVELTKFLWESGKGFESFGKFVSEASGAVKYLFENLGYVKEIMGRDIIIAVSHMGQTFETVFAALKNSVAVVYNPLVDLVALLASLAEKAAPVFDKLFGANTSSSMSGLAASIKTAKLETESFEETQSRLNTKYDAFRAEIEDVTQARIKANATTKEQIKTEGKAKDALEETVSSEKESSKELTKTKAKLDEKLYALTHTAEETELYNALLEAGVTAESESGRQIAETVKKIHTKINALEEEKEAAKKLKEEGKEHEKQLKALEKASKEAAEKSSEYWIKQRDVLSNFFFEFARDGLDAFDTLVEGFKAMIVKMIAEAAANQIILGVGAVIGGAANTAARSAVASSGGIGTSGLVSTGAGLYSALGGGITGLNTSLTTGLSSAGLGNLAVGFQSAGASIAPGIQGVNQVGLGAGMAAGAGIIGGYVGQKVFGNENSTGIGATAGSVAGAYVGSIVPVIGTTIGAGIGAFIGEGLETALGKAFGWKEGGNNAATGKFDLGTGVVNAALNGKNGGANLESTKGLVGTLQEFASAIGGSTLSSAVSVGSKDGIKYNGGKFKDADSFFAAAFRDIVKNGKEVDDALEAVILGFKGTTKEFAEFAQTQVIIDKLIKSAKNLSPQMEKTIRDFKGTNDEIILLAASMTSLSAAISTNAVSDASKAFKEMESILSKGLVGAYNSNVSALVKSVAALDGSAASVANLNNAMIASKQSAFDLAVGILNLQKTMKDMFTDSASSIKEQMMTEDERSKFWLDQRDYVMSLIPMMSNPSDIERASRQVNDLNTKIFSALDATEKLTFGKELADWATFAGQIVDYQLGKVLSTTQKSQENLMIAVGNTLNLASEKQIAAAEKMDAAVIRFAEIIFSIPPGFRSEVTG